jgi:hypothetical protein
MDLRFYLQIQRNHHPPYITIPGIHTKQHQTEEPTPDLHDLCGGVVGSLDHEGTTHIENVIPPKHSTLIDEDNNGAEMLSDREILEAEETEAYTRSSSPCFAQLLEEHGPYASQQETPGDAQVSMAKSVCFETEDIIRCTSQRHVGLTLRENLMHSLM